VEVAQAGLAAPGLLLEGSLFWVAESDEGSGSGRCGFANECLQLTLEGGVGAHAGEPRSGGVLRGWWLGIHHFVVAPLAVCHPLKEIEYQGFDCVKHGLLCPRVLSLYQAHRRSMAGLFAKLTLPSTRWCGLMPLFLEQQRRRLPHVGQTRHERSSNQRSPTRRNFSETSLITI